MPLHEVGYRGWTGGMHRPGAAAPVIAATGLRLAWQSRWLRRSLLFAWSPAVVFAVSVFAFERLLAESGADGLLANRMGGGSGIILRTVLGDALRGEAGGRDPAGESAGHTPDSLRRQVWRRLLLAFMRAPQAVLLAIVIGLVAPPLISRDVRAKAWLFYFTRPVGCWDYVVGKAAVLAMIVALVSLLPAVTLWLAGVLMSPSIEVAAKTCDLPLRIAAATVALAVPTVLMALACSAVTTESRIATFAWFAIWTAGWVAHAALFSASLVNAEPAPAAPGLVGPRWLVQAAGLDPRVDRWAWVSLYHAIGAVQAWIFGVQTEPAAFLPALAALATVSLLSLIVIHRRVTAPLRA